MARRGFIALGLLIICVIIMLFFKRSLKEGFVAPITTVSTFAGPNTPTIVSGNVNGQGTAARFNTPYGITIDSSGNLYVADTSNNTIRQIDTSGNVITFAGSTSGFADGIGTAAKFNRPFGIIIDPSGQNLYVADTSNNRIRKIVIATKQVSTIAGSTSGFADGNGTAAKFSAPYGITIDSSGNLYVADTSNNRIRKIVIATNQVSTIAGSTGSFEDGNGITTAKFYRPNGITIDPSGQNLYVGDTLNTRIRKIVIATNQVSTIAGSTSGFTDGNGTAAKFRSPNGITIDSSGNLYVADAVNARIRKIVIETNQVSTIAGPNGTDITAGNTDGINATFTSPQGITIDRSGTLYVADTGSHRIRKIGLACAAGSQLSGGDCVSCAAGTYGTDGSSCIPCAAGKFSAAGASSCTNCAAGTYSSSGASSCTSCGSGLTSPVGSTSQAACACPAGKTLATVNGSNVCISNCPTLRRPPNTQGSVQGMLIALSNCAANTFNYNNNGVMQTTNPCVNSFYDFDQQRCVNALGANVGLGSSTPCSSSTVYSPQTNACVPVRVIVKPNDIQLIDTKGSPAIGDFTACRTVDQGDCTIVFRDSLGNPITANPCRASNQLYNFATKTCVPKIKACCNYTDPLKAAADKACAADTSLVITKNTTKCPTNSRTLCCNNAYATNTTCIKNNFWRPSYQFKTSHTAKCTSGFQDYQGMHLLNKKKIKMNRII